jgi:hypothetical protein
MVRPPHPVDKAGPRYFTVLDGRTTHRRAQGPWRGIPGGASIASRILGNPETSGRNLLVHCAQEMNHLAGFLPELYDDFGNE